MQIGTGDATETAKLLRDRYSPIPRDQDEKVIDGIQKLLATARNPTFTVQSFLIESGRLIHRLFDFKEIAIGLKSKRDGLFRYEVLIGFSGDAEKARRRLAYTSEEMVDSEKYPGGVKVCKTTEFLLVEYQPYRAGEEDTFNRPNRLAKERSSADEIVEGDYIDIYLYGRNEEIMGWIELAGTRSGKMPPRSAIKWMELIASVMALVICDRESWR